jgi:sodium/hydrogen antiporter
VLLVSLVPTRLDRRSMALIAWFGPRGLSSLLLVLLPVFAGISNSASLFSLCSLVVLMSVLLHGGSVMLVGRRAGPPGEKPTAPVEELARKPVLPILGDAKVEPGRPIPEKIGIEELRALWDAGEPVVILDVRTQRSLEGSDATARGALRLDPERAVQEAKRLHLPQRAWLVAFCA